jgi:hypothetical protein
MAAEWYTLGIHYAIVVDQYQKELTVVITMRYRDKIGVCIGSRCSGNNGDAREIGGYREVVDIDTDYCLCKGHRKCCVRGGVRGWCCGLH